MSTYNSEKRSLYDRVIGAIKTSLGSIDTGPGVECFVARPLIVGLPWQIRGMMKR